MRQLQLEHNEWVRRKYPNQPPGIPAIGCLEEAGELVHAILKMEQVRVWGEDNRHKLVTLRQKLIDAIGDCGIYACSLCNANEWNFAELLEEASHFMLVTSGESTRAAIMLVQVATYVALDPYSKQRLFVYLCRLLEITQLLGLDLEMCIRTTWLTVKER